MKKLKTFLIVVAIFLLGSVVATAVVWYLLVLAPLKEAEEALNNTYENVEVVESAATEATTEATTEAATETVTGLAPIVIEKAALPEAQQSLIETFGFNGEQIVITPEAQICAEDKLGAARLGEIIAGDTPSFLEGASLVGCLSN